MSEKDENVNAGPRPGRVMYTLIFLAACIVLTAVLVLIDARRSGDGTLPPTVSEPPSGESFVPAGTVEVTTGVCREIYVSFGDGYTFRSRDFPAEWGPETTIGGTFRETGTEDEVIFVTEDGIEVAFFGGQGAAFTQDCPQYK
jgi:hypothetical protein